MKKNIYLIICPTYKCNLSCQFCYLTNFNKNDLLDLQKLEKQLKQISIQFNIKQIDLYGGEITILQKQYLNNLFSICLKYVKTINIVTNLINLIDQFYDDYTNINVGWDYIYKQNNQKALYNIKKLYLKTNKKINIIMSSNKLYKSKKIVLQILNNLPIYSFKYIPYIKTKYTNEQMDLYNYQETVKYFIKHPIKPIFYNKILLQNGIIQQNNHLFITPNNKFACIKYINNQQIIYEYQHFNKIINLQSKIPIKCLCCQNKLQCQSQHIYSYLNTNYDCIGLYKLIDWFNKYIKIK